MVPRAPSPLKASQQLLQIPSISLSWPGGTLLPSMARRQPTHTYKALLPPLAANRSATHDL